MKIYEEDGDTMPFQHDEENQCFSVEIDSILFSCEREEPFFEAIAQRLAAHYKNRLPAIAEYIVGRKEFLETYGKMTKEDFLKMLEHMTVPWIWLKDDVSGTIAYCDSEYVIEFVFHGDFEEFCEFSIDE